MQHIIRYLKGYLKIRVEGIYVERFLNMCCHHHIDLWNLKPLKRDYEMNISVSGFRKLKPILKKTRSKVIVIKKYGFPFWIYRYRKRTLFLVSFMLSVFLIYVSTFLLFKIEINGNVQYSEEMIIEKLDEIKVHTGIRKERINCEKVSQFLRSEFENITWASVHISGTKLMIEIKEKEEQMEEAENYDDKYANYLIADMSGEIVSIITRKGNPKVHIGDNVKKGDLLVSGEIEIKNDAGEVVNYHYVVPDADVIIKTTIKYEDSLMLKHDKKEFTNKACKLLRIENTDKIHWLGINYVERQNAITFYKEIFNIGKIKIGIVQIREYKRNSKIHTKTEYEKILNRNFMKFCEKMSKKGVQILENNVKIYSDSYCAFANGNLCVFQNIGEMRVEEKKELKEGN